MGGHGPELAIPTVAAGRGAGRPVGGVRGDGGRGGAGRAAQAAGRVGGAGGAAVDRPAGGRAGDRPPAQGVAGRPGRGRAPGRRRTTGAAVAPGEAGRGVRGPRSRPADDGGGPTTTRPAGRRLRRFWQPLPAGRRPAHLLGRTARPPPPRPTWTTRRGAGRLPMAGVAGGLGGVTRWGGRCTRRTRRRRSSPPARPRPRRWRLSCELDCPPGDPAGDRDLLRRVAASVTVDRDRPPGFAARRSHNGRPRPGGLAPGTIFAPPAGSVQHSRSPGV